MTPTELRRARRRLDVFFSDCFDGLGRRERREALASYLSGLLLDGERKSIAPIASRLALDPAQVSAVRQRMQQAVVVAEWDEWIVFERIAKKVERAVRELDAFVIDDTGFPKKGRHSVGVQRQYSGTMGRVDNCQVATSLHLASEHGGACIGMRVYLPERWANDTRRRDKAGVPSGVVFHKKWESALQMLDRALKWGLKPRPVVADAEYGHNHHFREALEKRGLSYVLNISDKLVVWPPGVVPKKPAREKRPGRPRTRWRSPDGEPCSIREVADAIAPQAWRTITWREGSKGPQSSRFAAVRVQTAHRHKEGRAPGPQVWLLCEWPKRADKPTTFWLADLPDRIKRKRLVYLAKLRWRIERDYQEMKSQLGLDHFEGRTWRGFHHHCACVAAAHAFLTLQRASFPPSAETDVSRIPRATSATPAPHYRALSHLSPPSLSEITATDVIK